jgi:type I restriction enzyme M protein
LIVLDEVFEKADANLAAPVRKAILSALGEQDDTADICYTQSGAVEADSDLRDHENVPLKEDIRDYFDREVTPNVKEAWINEAKKDEKDEQVGIVGYEIPLTRHFYKYVPPRPLEEIETEIAGLAKDIVRMLREVVG